MKIILLSFLICIAQLTIGQPPTLVWQKTFGGSFYDKAEQVIRTHEGGYAIVGSSQSNNYDLQQNRGLYDLCFVKLGNQGNVEWKVSMGSEGDDLFYSVVQRPDSSYILCGSSISSTFDFIGNYLHNDIWLVKINKQGSLVWKRHFGGTENDFGRKIINTADGGFIVLGTTESSDIDITNKINFSDAFLIKFNSSEQVEWTRCIGGQNNEIGYGVAQTTDGGFVICGNSNSTFAGANNYSGLNGFVAKVDNSGNILWQKNYGGSDNDSFRTILVTSQGNIVACGETYSDDFDATNNHGYGNRDYLALYLDANGNKIWSNCYGGSNNDYSREVIQSIDGNLVFCGETYSNDGNSTFTHGSADYWIFKINHQGQIIWQKSFGGAEHDEPNSIVETSDNGFLVVGNSASLNNGDVSGVHGDDDFWIVKLQNTEPCPEKLNIKINNTLLSATFTANDEIKSISKISQTSVLYKAGQKIELSAGFEAKSGTIFRAQIGGCQ